MRRSLLSLLCLAVAMLAGCGNKGPLYMPNSPNPPVYVPPKPVPAPSATATGPAPDAPTAASSAPISASSSATH
ncbi:LPS translocon maturation chaperone LptM [Rhodanobacter hydrolyticus]|uniref:Lipoprotein n=1 Tax=Rhodanobacter hydrolyticus TaxID=2250595 RepID=A0ABW8JAC2_9GAMM